MFKNKLTHNLTPQTVFDFLSQLVIDANHRILLVELILLSVIFGAVPHLWPVACLMLLGLFWVLSKPKGVFYMIYILSFGWGLMSLCIAYFIGGWGWAIGAGICVLFGSLGIHFRDLKQPLYSVPDSESSPELKQNLPFGRFNLN